MVHQNETSDRYPLLLGTQNPGKLRELTALLVDLPLQIILPESLPIHLDIPEDGTTYLENASHKAVTWASQTGLAALADDSGLEVELLEGAPGLYSHRFTGNPLATDAERRRYLINKLLPQPRPWKARFYCSVVVAFPNQEPISASGICPGEILPEERGVNGFGYDPIFLVEGLHKTMAELRDAEKNRVSHRARAVLNLKPLLLDRISRSHS